MNLLYLILVYEKEKNTYKQQPILNSNIVHEYSTNNS